MRFAIPVANEKLSMHFGHCEKFVILDVDDDTKEIAAEDCLDAPPHQPGLLPAWLAEKNVNVIIAGGMGQRAQALFTQNDIAVFVGAPAETPQTLVSEYLKGALESGGNICDH